MRLLLQQRIEVEGFERLPLQPPHLTVLATLPILHRDPFDHAQAIAEAEPLVTDDRLIRRYPVEIFQYDLTE